jgi:L-alanine-DL-glutamate epimerase-like enolase superfamily enzyme
VSDLDAAWWLAESPVDGAITYAGSTITLPTGSGLGLTLREKA